MKLTGNQHHQYKIYTPEGAMVGMIESFDTETCEAQMYEKDETGKVKVDEKGQPKLFTRILAGHYAVDPQGNTVPG